MAFWVFGESCVWKKAGLQHWPPESEGDRGRTGSGGTGPPRWAPASSFPFFSKPVDQATLKRSTTPRSRSLLWLSLGRVPEESYGHWGEPSPHVAGAASGLRINFFLELSLFKPQCPCSRSQRESEYCETNRTGPGRCSPAGCVCFGAQAGTVSCSHHTPQGGSRS